MNHPNICAAHESAIANLRLLESEYGAAFSSDIIDHIERAISDIETASHMGERTVRKKRNYQRSTNRTFSNTTTMKNLRHRRQQLRLYWLKFLSPKPRNIYGQRIALRRKNDLADLAVIVLSILMIISIFIQL